MKNLLAFVTLAIVFIGISSSAKNCDPAKSKPCGNSCISLTKECQIEPAKKCGEKSKPCGKGCISKDKECHK